MAVLSFPIAPRGDFCLACGQPMVAHGKACVRDVVIGQDQHAIARRLRLARLQIGRGLKLDRFRHRVEERQ